MRRWAVVGVALAAAATVVVAIVLSSGNDEVVLPLGEGEITVPVEGNAASADQARAAVIALVEQVGLPPDVVDCYRREVEALDDADLQKLIVLQARGASLRELSKATFPLRREIERECLAGTQASFPKPSELDSNQVELIKEGFARQISTGRISGERFPPAIGAYVADRIREMSASEFVELNEAPAREIEATFFEYGRKCANQTK